MQLLRAVLCLLLLSAAVGIRMQQEGRSERPKNRMHRIFQWFGRFRGSRRSSLSDAPAQPEEGRVSTAVDSAIRPAISRSPLPAAFWRCPEVELKEEWYDGSPFLIASIPRPASVFPSMCWTDIQSQIGEYNVQNNDGTKSWRITILVEGITEIPPIVCSLAPRIHFLELRLEAAALPPGPLSQECRGLNQLVLHSASKNGNFIVQSGAIQSDTFLTDVTIIADHSKGTVTMETDSLCLSSSRFFRIVAPHIVLKENFSGKHMFPHYVEFVSNLIENRGSSERRTRRSVLEVKLLRLNASKRLHIVGPMLNNGADPYILNVCSLETAVWGFKQHYKKVFILERHMQKSLPLTVSPSDYRLVLEAMEKGHFVSTRDILSESVSKRHMHRFVSYARVAP